MREEAPELWERYKAETAEFGVGEEDAGGYLGKTSELREEEHLDGWVTHRCVDFVEGRLGDKLDEERSLFLYLSFIKPHAGFNVPAAFEALYDLDTIPDIVDPPGRRNRTRTCVRFSRSRNS